MLGAAMGALQIPLPVAGRPGRRQYIRLGAQKIGEYNDPETWVKRLKDLGFRAADCPLKPGASLTEIRAYETAARRNDIVIAEVGAWSNPLSPDPPEAERAMVKCREALALADEIGARCCVNVSGSLNPEYWAGPHEDNLTPETFDRVVETTRKIIDEVRPGRTFFTLEMMPWSFPDSTRSYLDLLKAVDRQAFGVHLDPVNMITSPRVFFNNGAMIKDAFEKLGPHIKSCHAKDMVLREDIYTPHLSEVRPGLGKMDYRAYLSGLAALDDVPLIMEHLDSVEEYVKAAGHIRSVGKELGIEI